MIAGTAEQGAPHCGFGISPGWAQNSWERVFYGCSVQVRLKMLPGLPWMAENAVCASDWAQIGRQLS